MAMGHGVCRRGPNSNRPTPNCCVLNSHATTPQCELKLLARPMVSRTTESNRHPHGVLREGLLTCRCFTLRRTAMTMERSYLKLKAAESEANRLGKAGAALKSPSAKKASHRPCTPTPCSRWACGRNAAALAFEPELADLGKETAARLICHRALEFALSPKGVEMLHRGGNLRREEWGDGPVRRMRPNGRKAPQHTPAHCNAWHPVVVTWSIAQPARPDRPPASSSRGRPARRPGCLRGCPRPRARLARPSRRAR